MVGFDHLLATSLNQIIIKNLGNSSVKKIEDRLFEKFGISLTQSIEEFDKLDLVLREFFGKGADGLERNFFKDLVQINSKKSKEMWHTLTDDHVNEIILQAFGDSEKKKIMETVSNSSKIIAIILKECKLPQTSGYRKINQLIDDGLLVQSGYVMKDNKKINKYVCIFNNLKINIEKNHLIVDVQLTKLEQENSSILQIIKN